MAIISFDPEETIAYIPRSERGSADPCVVNLKFVPFSLVQKYSQQISRLQAERTRSVKDPVEVMEISTEVARSIQRKQFCERVVSIENFSVKGKPVTEPGEFYDLADTDLITEIIRAMEDAGRLSEGQRKN